jgi:hypothetical protein
MKRNLIKLVIISGLFAIASLNSVAQEKKPAPDGMKVATDETFKVLAAKSIFGKVVKGAPYSAIAITETTQTLSDGNQIIRKNQSKQYRDSEGRTRIEQTLETIGKWTADGEAQQLVTINDPVASFSYRLDPRNRTAFKSGTSTMAENLRVKLAMQEKMEAIKQASPDKLDAIKLATQAKLEAEKLASAEMTAKKTKPWELEEGLSGDPRRKTELLGKQMIEGVEAVGTRSVFTIPAGEIGNVLPIEVIDETWYSPELQLMVMTKRRDPRSGETTYRLTNINRNEPDRSLFEVPADYNVKENTILFKQKPTKEDQ